MKIKLSIRRKISLFVLIPLSVYIIILIVFIGVRFTNQAEFDNGHTSRLLSERSAAHAEIVLKDHYSNIRTLAGILSDSRTSLDSTQREFFKQTLSQTCGQGQMYWLLLPSGFYADSNLLDNDWVLMQANSGAVSLTDDYGLISNNYSSILGTNSTVIGKPYEHNGHWMINFSTPIYQNNNVCGYACKAVDVNDFDFMSAKVAAAFNKEVTKYLINEDGIIVFTNNSADINRKYTVGYIDTAAIADMHRRMAKGEYLNYAFEQNGVPMCTYCTPINIGPDCNWSLALTFPTSNVADASRGSIRTVLIIAVIGLLIMLVLIYLIARNMTMPIKNTTDALKLLAAGDTEGINTLNIKTNDELEEMSDSLNQVVDGIRKSENFALSIGKGEFETDFHTLGDKDRLGDALIQMRDSLVESQKIEAQRKEEEDLRNWTTEGIAKFGEILRKDQNNMKALGYNIMSNLIDYLNVNQGALFVLNDDNPDDLYYSLVTAIAYGRDKFIKKEIRVGEGLVGRCIYERKTIYLTEIPDDYIKITSGLGTANPRCILIVPCIINDETLGVMEIASFNELKQHEIEFVEKLGESIASTLSSVKVTEKTSRLLNDSRVKSDELTSQEEELRQNLEEMQATQEDLRRQMEENTTMRETLTKEQALMDSLMNNVNDVIFFKDLDLRYIKVSNSFYTNFGMTEEMVIGKTDREVTADAAATEKSINDDTTIIRTGKPLPEEVQEVGLADGSSVFIKTSKYPLFDADGKIIGVFGVTSNVTDVMKMRQNKE
ncbi:MAG: GAF domain-containing protein [Salinivirgaceae bacterium]|nr:GAF domain-containing protein [Salinivirgaceae bacterium]